MAQIDMVQGQIEQVDAANVNGNGIILLQHIANYELARLDMARSRRRIKQCFLETAEYLEKQFRNSKIVRVTGAPISIIGSGLAIGGFITGFFTFGVGWAIGIAGVAVSASGAALGVAGVATDLISTKVGKIRATALLDDDNEILARLISTEEHCFESLKMFFRTSMTVYNVLDTTIDVAKLGSTGTVFAETVFKSLSTSGKVVASLGVAAAALAIPFDIYEIVTSSIAIHTNKAPEFATKLREYADEMQIETDDLIRSQAQEMRNAVNAM